MPSRSYAGSAAPKPLSQPSSTYRRRQSAASETRRPEPASAIEPAEPRPRYERKTPGEIIHIDIKKLGRFNAIGHRITGNRSGQSNQRGNGTAPGWEFVHVAIDDHSRVAFSQILPDEKQASAVDFLEAAVQYYYRLGVISPAS